MTPAEFHPRVHEELEREELPNGSLLYTWRGTARERPLLLMAHHDVVPAPPECWSRDPFGGEIDGGAVHGRGVLDDKGPLVCMFEAVEGLLAAGFTPAQDVLLFTGADEETVGDGSKAAAARLRERGVTPWLVSDEGGAIVERGMLPGTADTPVAAAGIAAVDPALAVVPYLQSGSTDSRHLTGLTPAVYRFAPLVMTAAQRRSLHGTDEHVTVAALEAGVRFHRSLIHDHR